MVLVTTNICISWQQTPTYTDISINFNGFVPNKNCLYIKVAAKKDHADAIDIH